MLNKRPDGYHNINTIFHKINFYDEIIIENNSKFELECYPDLNIPIENNLIFRSTTALANHHEVDLFPIKLTVKKSIPTGAGLGGGSSNAAYTLIGIDKFLNLKTEKKDLLEIAQNLGSDVPFFIGDTNTALGSGRGEILEFLQYTLPYSILLIFPQIHVSTPKAYSSLNRSNTNYASFDFRSVLVNDQTNTESLKVIFNDFEESVFNMYPVLSEIKGLLIESGAIHSLMSGSGSTIFGLFETQEKAKNAQNILSSYRSQICNSLLY